MPRDMFFVSGVGSGRTAGKRSTRMDLLQRLGGWTLLGILQRRWNGATRSLLEREELKPGRCRGRVLVALSGHVLTNRHDTGCHPVRFPKLYASGGGDTDCRAETIATKLFRGVGEA